MWSLVRFKILCKSFFRADEKFALADYLHTHSFFCFGFVRIFFYFLVVLGIEQRTLCMAGEHTPLSCIPAVSVCFNLEIRLHKVAHAGLKLWSFCLRFLSSWNHRSVPLGLPSSWFWRNYFAASQQPEDFFPSIVTQAHGRKGSCLPHPTVSASGIHT